MYELTIRADSLFELKGRIQALATEFNGAAITGLPITAAAETPVTAATSVPLSGPETEGEIPYSTVRNAFLKLATLKGREAVGEVLSQFGASKTAQELDPATYATVVAAIEQRLAS